MKKLIIIIVFFMLNELNARSIENIKNTDYFSDIVLLEEDSLDQKKFNLSNLNLCYGAELFLSTAVQALYHNGDVVRLKKEEELESLKNKTQAIRSVYKTHFYRVIEDSENSEAQELTYQEIAPLHLLCRLLFYQIPGTDSLDDFRVSNCFRGQQALEDWAHLTALAVKKIYEYQENNFSPNEQNIKAFEEAYAKLNCNLRPTGPKHVLNFVDLIKRSIKQSDSNGFGVWFPVRILIAGAYEQFGNDKKQITSFYKILQKRLSEQIKVVKKPKKNGKNSLHPIVDQAIKKVNFSDVSQQKVVMAPDRTLSTCFANLYTKKVPFRRVSYNGVTLKNGSRFQDCFENAVRNVCSRILFDDSTGTFNAQNLPEPFRLFYEKYNSMDAQFAEGVRTEWSELVHDAIKPIAFCNSVAGLEDEFIPSLANFFIALKAVLGLDVPSVTSYQDFQKIVNQEEQSKKLGEQYAEIHQALIEKFNGRTITFEDDVLVETKQLTFGFVISGYQKILRFGIAYNNHGNTAQSDNPDYRSTEESIEPIIQQNFPYITTYLVNMKVYPDNPCFLLPLFSSHLTNLFNCYDDLNYRYPLIKRMIYAAICQNYKDKDYSYWYDQLIINYALASGTKIKDADAIEILELKGHFIKNKDIQRIVEIFPNIVSLSLSSCYGITSLRGIEKLEKLQKLTISSCSNIKSFADVRICKNILELDLSLLKDSQLLTGIENFQNLKCLKINISKAPNIFSDIIKLENLEDLKLEGCDNFTSLDGIENLKNLKSLYIRKCSHLRSTKGIETLTNLTTPAVIKDCRLLMEK